MSFTSKHLADEDFRSVFEKGYGWRARIGHLSPSLIDETGTAQFYRMAPRGVTLVQTSLRAAEMTPEGIRAAIERAEEAALELAKEAPDCIIVGGSPTAIVGGIGSDTHLAEHLEKVTGLQTTTTQASVIEGMRLLGMERLAVVTPTAFNERWHVLLREFLEASGFSVLSLKSLPDDERGHLGYVEQVAPKLEYELARQAFEEAKNADGIYFPGAPAPVVDIIELLERELGTKVVTNGQAMLWKGMKMAGVDLKIEGYGELLRQ